MKKLSSVLVALTLTLTMLTGCLTGQNPTPVIVPHITGAAAAFNAYCTEVSEEDTEIQRICSTYAPTINVVAGAAETALNLIFSVLTKREAQKRQLERSSAVECHK